MGPDYEEQIPMDDLESVEAQKKKKDREKNKEKEDER